MTPNAGKEAQIRKVFEVFLLSKYMHSARGVLTVIRASST